MNFEATAWCDAACLLQLGRSTSELALKACLAHLREDEDARAEEDSTAQPEENEAMEVEENDDEEVLDEVISPTRACM